MLGPTPIPTPIATPPAPATAPTPLEEIYEEFYYDLSGWENAYILFCGRCKEEGDEKRARQALKDFDTIMKVELTRILLIGMIEVHASLRGGDGLYLSAM